MKISIGADHRGFELKEALKKARPDIVWFDVGTDSKARCDYSPIAKKTVEMMFADQSLQGVLICGSGAGMAIAANRHKKIYAAVCSTVEQAVVAKADDNMNILVLPADCVTVEQALAILNGWQTTLFKGGIYAERLAALDL